MRQNPVGEPEVSTAALNFGTPRRRSSLKRLCPLPSYICVSIVSQQSTPRRSSSGFFLLCALGANGRDFCLWQPSHPIERLIDIDEGLAADFHYAKLARTRERVNFRAPEAENFARAV